MMFKLIPQSKGDRVWGIVPSFWITAAVGGAPILANDIRTTAELDLEIDRMVAALERLRSEGRLQMSRKDPP